jgi:hypothetical protein
VNTKVPILDVVLVLLVVGLALTPWPWLALIGGAAYFAVIAFVIDSREAPAPAPPDEDRQP